MRRILYGPPNWLVTRFSSEDRRMFGFWTVIIAIIGTVLCAVFGVRDFVWFLWLAAISVVALIPNFSSETPVEEEDKG